MPKSKNDWEDLDLGPPVNEKKDEIDFKRHVLGAYPFWGCPYEPGTGSATGYPDLQLMHDRSKQLLPVELKVGVVKNGRVFPREVRPSQITWHHNFALAGGRACLLTGIKLDRNWRGYAVPGSWAEHWRLGFPVADCFWLDNHEFVSNLVELVDVFLHQRLNLPLRIE